MNYFSGCAKRWTKQEAIKEMTEGGFGFHRAWGDHLIEWINNLDIGKIKQKAGISKNIARVADQKN